jgi:hypothetical protein
MDALDRLVDQFGLPQWIVLSLKRAIAPSRLHQG